jgi:hypothetical protein
MSADGYRVRAAVFVGRNGGAVFHPAGGDNGSRRRGFPISPPPLYRPPGERTWTVKTLEAARKKALALRLEFGEAIAIHVEPIDASRGEPRPVQLELDDWPHARPK